MRGGPLHPALVVDRIDVAHPAARSWMAKGRRAAAPQTMRGYPETEVFLGPLGVAELAGCNVNEVYAAVPNGLGDALDLDRLQFDITSRPALEFFRRHPLADEDVEGFPLAAAAVGENIDVEHPHALVFAARRGVQL